MEIEVKTISEDSRFSNSYLLISGKESLLIDPGYNEKHFLEKEIKKSKTKLLGILLTHGHFDHFAGLLNFAGLKKIPVYISPLDKDYLKDPTLNVSATFAERPVSIDIETLPLEDGQEIELGSFVFKVIATPFHTPGSTCLYFENAGFLISGDTLMHNAYGRYDLPGGSPHSILSSLRKLRALPKETILYPGHGEITTIGEELS